MSAGFSIGGLASGIDTSSLITQLMQVERIPIQSMQREQATFRKGVDAYASITTRVTALRTAARKLDNLNDFNAFVSATTNNAAVSAVATGGAKPGSLTFTVDQLASQHQLFGSDTSSFADSSSLVGAGTFTITLFGGAEHSVTTNSSTTLADLASAVNGLGIGVSAAAVKKSTGDFRLMLTSSDTGSDASFSVTAAPAAVAGFTTVSTAGDAKITFGSGASAVEISRSTNTIGDLVDGVTLTLNQTTTSPVTVTTSRDLDAAVEAVNSFVTELNATLSQLDAARKWDQETGGGPLTGSAAVRQVVEGIRRAVSQPVESLSGTYNYASSVGLEIQRNGSFVLNESKLREALAADFGAVADLFAASASATDQRVQFGNATSATKAGTYAVSITQAAAVASTTSGFATATADDSFDITIGGQTISVGTSNGDDVAAVVSKINAALTAGGISTLLASVSGSEINLATSGYGAAFTFDIGANSHGLTVDTYTGVDVAGTINGLAATGTGRQLKSTTGDSTGLALTVSASQAEVDAENPLALGTVDYSTGIAGNLNALLDDYLGSSGVLSTAKDSLEGRVTLYQDRIDAFERRLVLREDTLRRQFAAMEKAISSLQSQANFFAAQLNQGQG